MIIPLEYAVGVGLAIGVCGFAWAVGFDRDRAFYPVLAVVSASYYVLFAAMSGSRHALAVESLVTAGFALVAVLGFKRNLWLVVACFAGHGVFDSLHGLVAMNPGVPPWWPDFCMTFDVAAAACLACYVLRRKVRTPSVTAPIISTMPMSAAPGASSVSPT